MWVSISTLFSPEKFAFDLEVVYNGKVSRTKRALIIGMICAAVGIAKNILPINN